MIDHLARAKEMRRRAEKCKLSAEHTKSEKFANCYRLLAQNYDILATVEAEFMARAIASHGQNEYPASMTAHHESAMSVVRVSSSQEDLAD